MTLASKTYFETRRFLIYIKKKKSNPTVTEKFMHNLLWQKVVTGYFRIEGGGIAKRQEALWGWQLYSLSMVMVAQVHVYVKGHQRLYLKYVQFGASQVVLVVKNPPANAGDSGSIPGSGRSPGGGHGNPLQYSCLENPTDRGAWRATAHRVSKSQTRLKQLSMHTHMYSLSYVSYTSI